jgi:hypothetical protein
VIFVMSFLIEELSSADFSIIPVKTDAMLKVRADRRLLSRFYLSESCSISIELHHQKSDSSN